MFNVFVGALLGSCVGLEPLYGAGIGVVVPMALGNFMPHGALCEGVFTEIWTGEMIKTLKTAADALFLTGVPDYSRYAENDVIHMVDIGIDPDVLINNTTYPIAIQELKDGDKIFQLDKFQTKVTPITDDELHACSYDKIGSVKDRHAEAINEKKYAKAIHALAPQSNSLLTPVLETTGEVIDGRKRLTRKDILSLKSKMDNNKIPVQGRRLVLCADHINDLLSEDQKFQEQYYNYTTGKIANMYGFEIFEFVENPLYTAAGTKEVFGKAAAADDRCASVAFHLKNVFKAAGSTKMYYSEAKTDPENQRNLINFRHYFVVLPKQAKACGAIISAKAV